MTTSDDETAPPAAAPVPPSHGRAGRDLPVAIGVGLALGAAVVLTLVFFKPGFAAIVAVALSLGAVEVHKALRRITMNAAIVPIVVGTVGIVIGSYYAGQATWAPLPSNTFLLAALAATVLAALAWRIPQGPQGYVRDAAASLFIIGYIPLLGSFAALLLAGADGVLRMVTMIVVVVAGDVGGYAVGVLLGRHPMAPRISPKKSWEGFAGSLVLGVAAAIGLCVLGFHVPVWVGVVLGVSVVLVGVAGDLVESLIKRDVGIKDMSSFIPGHGGVMDRLDSLLVAAPVAWFVMYLLVPGG